MDAASKLLFGKERVHRLPSFQEKLTAEVVHSSSDHGVVLLEVTYGCYRMCVTVALEDRESHSHSLAEGCASSNAAICLTASAAIKCFRYAEDAMLPALGLALREFCLFKIAAALGVGPRLPRVFGFDLVVFSQCIEFSMERCLNYSQSLIHIGDPQLDQLKQRLGLLHAFGVVHLDIKPLNIMYSEAQRGFVLIDYGYSKTVREQIGRKSLIDFRGSISYCSPEMLGLYTSKEAKPQPVDLYYNDLHALQVSLR
jgi:hypothetical protein